MFMQQKWIKEILLLRIMIFQWCKTQFDNGSVFGTAFYLWFLYGVGVNCKQVVYMSMARHITEHISNLSTDKFTFNWPLQPHDQSSSKKCKQIVMFFLYVCMLKMQCKNNQFLGLQIWKKIQCSVKLVILNMPVQFHHN